MEPVFSDHPCARLDRPLPHAVFDPRAVEEELPPAETCSIAGLPRTCGQEDPLKILRGPGVPPNHWRLVASKLGRLHVATNGKPSARPPLVRGTTNFRVCPESMCRNYRQSFPWFRGPSWISRISASSTTGSVALLVRHHELLPMLTLSTTSEHSHISASTMTPAQAPGNVNGNEAVLSAGSRMPTLTGKQHK